MQGLGGFFLDQGLVQVLHQAQLAAAAAAEIAAGIDFPHAGILQAALLALVEVLPLLPAALANIWRVA